MLACKIALFASEFPRNGYCAFAFQETDHGGHRMLRRNLYAHMDMVRHQMSFQNPTFLLSRQFMEDRSKLLSDLPENNLSAPLGDKNHVILAIPL